MTEARRLVVVDEWSGKYLVNEFYRPIAEALVKKFDEIKHVPVEYILFIDNTDSKGMNRNKIKYAQIGKLPEKWLEVIYQLTGRSFGYFMEVFKRNIQDLSREQIVALIYHELRHIGKDGEIVLHDIEDWANMHYKLGPDWANTKRVIPDLLEEGINWDIIYTPRLFEEPKLRAVK